MKYDLEKEIAKEKRQKEQKKLREEELVNWIHEGESLIYKERYNKWRRYVMLVSNSLNYGLEIEVALKIMKALNEGIEIEEAINMLYQDVRVYTSTVRNILFQFSERGVEFIEADMIHGMDDESKAKILEKKMENNLLRSKKNLIHK